MKRILPAILLSVSLFAFGAGIDKMIVVGHDEMQLSPEEILHLPGLGLSLRCDGDTLLLLDDPVFARINLPEASGARSLVSLRSGIYSASGDSIIRVASDTDAPAFIGRLDNEQFTLYNSTDSTFYALTADEEFSCVYEIYPDSSRCDPVIGINGPIQKIEGNGTSSMVWMDDAILRLHEDGYIENIYQADNITCMALTPIGVMVGTTEGVYWLTALDKGAMIIKEPVKGLWWDDSDALYYLTSAGDLIAVTGMWEAFNQYTER